jgi:predicted HTH domain antitoxin
LTTKGRPVTKSIRLSPEESKLLAEVSAREHLAEGSLLRKWVLEALAHARVEQAVTDHETGEVNLGEAAAQAEVTISRFMAELERRGVDTVGPAHFEESLRNLTDLFGGSAELRAVMADRSEQEDRH